MIKIAHHNYGFFSCCSVKLRDIVNLVNSTKDASARSSLKVDSSDLFTLYKKECDANRDITYDFFKKPPQIGDGDVYLCRNGKFCVWDQFENYSTLDYDFFKPFISRYFSPSRVINQILTNLEKKYNLDYKNTIAVYYRGTDKRKETKLASFDQFYSEIKRYVSAHTQEGESNNDPHILVQTDSSQFLDYIKTKNLDNLIVINENKTSDSAVGFHNKTVVRDSNYYHMMDFLPTVIAISKCKRIVCSSGNCSLWMMLYRGNAKNVSQYLNGTWFY